MAGESYPGDEPQELSSDGLLKSQDDRRWAQFRVASEAGSVLSPLPPARDRDRAYGGIPRFVRVPEDEVPSE